MNVHFAHTLRICSALLTSICILIEPAVAEKQPAAKTAGMFKTTPEAALACFNQALNEAKSGTEPDTMIKKYLKLDWITARALFLQNLATWKNLTDSDRTFYQQQVQDYINTNATFDIKLETVEKPHVVRPIGNGQELANGYEDTTGALHSFGVIAMADGAKTCFFIDARWQEVWMSKIVPIVTRH
jgi:hypothetical protein